MSSHSNAARQHHSSPIRPHDSSPYDQDRIFTNPSSVSAAANSFIQSSPLSSSRTFDWFRPSSPEQDSQCKPDSAPVFTSPGSKRSNSHYHRPERIFRPNPLLQRPEDARDRRRNLFLRKLQHHRDERILQARGGEDEMMRVIYLSEKRRWEDSHERAASALPTADIPLEEELEVDSTYSDNQDMDVAMVDEMVDFENRELEALIHQYNSEFPETENPASFRASLQTCSRCGSDEILRSKTEVTCFNCGFSYQS